MNATIVCRRVALAALAPVLLLAACGRHDARDADWQRVSSQRQVSGEESLRAVIEYGAGRLTVEPAAPPTLYAVDMRYDASFFRPRTDYADGVLRVGLEGSGSVRGRNIGDGHLRLGFAPDVPLDLELKFGAGAADVQLGGLAVRQLRVATGASETKLDIATPNAIECRNVTLEAGAARLQTRGLGNLNTGSLEVSGGVGDLVLGFNGGWQRDMRAKVNMGLGRLTLELPRGLGVRINRSGGLTRFDGQELVRRGESYYSQDWDSAQRRLTIDMDAALGSVRVVWTDGTSF